MLISKENGVSFAFILQISPSFAPTELEDLQNQYAALQELGVEVYSVSTDTHFTHKAWHDTSDAIKKITYFMIGDPSHVVSRNFEVLIEAKGLADRGTFIIDPDGVIQAVEINAGGIGRDASALFKQNQKPHNTSGKILTKFARPNGTKVQLP